MIVSVVNGVHDFVSFLEQMRHERLRGLPGVPGALPAQKAHEAERMFYEHDRMSVRELAALWRPDVEPSQNQAYVARAKELQKDLETAFLNRGDEDEKKRA